MKPMTAASKLKMPYAEYVAREAASDVRHEFIDGEVFAMAGGTPEHSALIAAVTMALAALRKGPCRAFVTELRTRIRADEKGPDVGTYPDIAIVCGAVERDSEDPISIVNPTVVIEVLSNSTEAYDRHGKFEHYKRLESLREYVLVSQHEPKIERFSKVEGSWTAEHAAAGGRVDVASVGVQLVVDEIYEGLVAADGTVRVR
jgi:Uma2 family endonuclease